ncbi:hypothetical protein [Polyangium sp. 6x1]|uniref:hypothetical protein n=1 Tax=Polyangium sp. 6x1 TaxID=3042689 RepID=UPI0024831C72|nr:hypothetical protein [Polyangium sp. 6x1]MDI1444622.1 hypothetical protein [Polyangium sp. 6x1]
MLSFAGCAGFAEDPPTDIGSDDSADDSAEAPEDLQGQVGRGRACLSNRDCRGPNFVCSTSRGDCHPPPGCNPRREICPAICYGVCESARPPRPPGGELCGRVTCPHGTTCCNPLMSICTPPGRACIL